MKSVFRTLILAAVLAAGVYGCQPESTTQSTPAEAAQSNDAASANAADSPGVPITPRLKPEQLAEQTFRVPAGRPAEVQTQAGFQFAVPANAFVDAQGRPFTGNVTLAVREATTVGQFIRSGLVTMAGHTPLRSGGMFQVTARDAATGADLRLAPGKKIEGTTPEMSMEYSLFRGSPTPNGGIDWVQPVAMQTVNAGRPERQMRESVAQNQASGTGDVPYNRGPFDEYIATTSTLVPIPDSVWNQMQDWSRFVDTAGTQPVYQALFSAPAPAFKFRQMWARFYQASRTTQIVPCTNVSALSAWQNQHRVEQTSGYLYVWVNNRLLAHRSLLNQMGLDAQLLNLKQLGVLKPANGLPENLRGMYLDITDLVAPLNRACELIGLFSYAEWNDRDLFTVSEVLSQVKEIAKMYVLQQVNVTLLQQKSAVDTTIDFMSSSGHSGFFKLNNTIYADMLTVSRSGLFPQRGWNQNRDEVTWFFSFYPFQNELNISTNIFLFTEVYYSMKNMPDDTPVSGILRTGSFVNETMVYDPAKEIRFRNLRELRAAADKLMAAQRQFSNTLSRQFNFSLSETGWYNCDIYMREPWQEQALTADLGPGQTPANTQLYVVYPKEKMVFQFPLQADGSARVRLFNAYQGQILLVSGSEASAAPARIQATPLNIQWSQPRSVDAAVASR